MDTDPSVRLVTLACHGLRAHVQRRRQPPIPTLFDLYCDSETHMNCQMCGREIAQDKYRTYPKTLKPRKDSHGRPVHYICQACFDGVTASRPRIQQRRRGYTWADAPGRRHDVATAVMAIIVGLALLLMPVQAGAQDDGSSVFVPMMVVIRDGFTQQEFESAMLAAGLDPAVDTMYTVCELAPSAQPPATILYDVCYYLPPVGSMMVFWWSEWDGVLFDIIVTGEEILPIAPPCTSDDCQN